MKRCFIIGLVLIGILIVVTASGCSGPKVSNSAVPVPPSLTNLPTITPEPWVKIEDNPGTFLEGPAFDRQGNLFVTSMFDGRVFKITPDKQVTTIFNNSDLITDGIAIHKDGRLFIGCLNGKLIVINPDGSNLTYIEPRYHDKPLAMNDLIFNSKGNLYVSDFTGNIGDPTGGVYRFSADMKTVQPVIENLASANGLALTQGGDILWVSETCRGEILRLELLEDGITINPVAGATIPYRFTGAPGGPDSNAIDVEGNVYQCLIFQGRILVLNKGGIPIANVLIPGRDEGKHLGTTNIAFKPGTDEAVMTAWGEGGAWMYKFRGLAKGATLFSHQ